MTERQAHVGPRIMKPLFRMLQQKINETFEQTAPDLHRRLVEALGDGDAATVPAVRRILEEALLSAPDEQIRIGAAQILKNWGEASLVRLYCQAAEDQSPRVREAAASTVFATWSSDLAGVPEVVTLLVKIMKADDPKLRIMAILF